MAYYNNLSKITVYQQPTSSSCAATCLCMTMKVPPATVSAAGYDLDFLYWDTIANNYGYDTTETGSLTFTEVISWLKKGYPVIAKIADEDVNEQSDHWVVIAAFAGDESNPTAPYFTCADPYYGDTRQLSMACLFSGQIYNSRIVNRL